jgi:type III pantothenate kinase
MAGWAPVLLVVDVGNTQTHFGAFRADELVQHWRFATERTETCDELAAKLAGMLALHGLGFDDLDGSIVSSTVPALAVEWEGMGRRFLGHPTAVVGPNVRTGMPIRIDNPRELGADRLVNAVAAFDRIGAACIVVDFGTAITYDVVSDDGALLGALISPGVEISLEALAERAARLPRVELVEPRALIGKSTIDAIRAGVVYGFAGQVDGIVRRLRAEMGPGTHVIATGGLAHVVVPFCEGIDTVDDLLTLQGLRIIHGRNLPSR